ncbi:MAG: endonuclease III [Vampirovibrionia bacterium]
MDVDINAIMEILSTSYDNNKLISSMEEADDPYKLLISCIMSLRTKDEITYPVAKKLFQLAGTPEEMINLDRKIIEETIYPIGFYKNKTDTILHISQILIEKYKSKVPADMDKLLEIKGIGRKTANLVLARGFRIPAICVDTHVHRISNRIGYVQTKTPEQTEMELRRKLPKEWWFSINTALVRHGQETCKPIGARCHECPIEKLCPQIDVKKAKPKTKKK